MLAGLVTPKSSSTDGFCVSILRVEQNSIRTLEFGQMQMEMEMEFKTQNSNSTRIRIAQSVMSCRVVSRHSHQASHDLPSQKSRTDTKHNATQHYTTLHYPKVMDTKHNTTQHYLPYPTSPKVMDTKCVGGRKD